MSNLRERAAQIKAAGEAERDNFQPQGLPLHIYRYWEQRSPHAPSKYGRTENFCHFWRVVAFWSPLMYIGNAITRVGTSKTGQGVISLVLLVALIVMGVASRDFLQAVVLGFVLGLGLLILGTAAYFIHKSWRKSWNKWLERFFYVLTGAIMVFAVVALLVSLFLDFGLIALLYIVGFVSVVTAFIFGLATLSDFIQGRRAVKRAEYCERLHKMTEEEYEEHTRQSAEPGKVSKFFSALGDVLVFAFQIVRVKKWKICPIVTVPKDA